jgi:hypothetical protein
MIFYVVKNTVTVLGTLNCYHFINISIIMMIMIIIKNMLKYHILWHVSVTLYIIIFCVQDIYYYDYKTI